MSAASATVRQTHWQTESEFIAERRAAPEKFYRWRRRALTGPQDMREGKLDHRLRADYFEMLRKQVKEVMRSGGVVPENIIAQRPEYAKAHTDYERYLKGRHTSFANRSLALVDLRDTTGYKAKRQDGKPLSSNQTREIDNMVRDIELAGIPIRNAMRVSDLTICHTSGRHPFLSDAVGLYHVNEVSISVGVGVSGREVRSLAHEVGHWLDYEGSAVEREDNIVLRTSHSAKWVSTKCQSDLDQCTTEFIRKANESMNLRFGRGGDMRTIRRIFGKKASDRSIDERITEVRVGRYWTRNAEIWARLVEQWVATKLGRSSAAADSPSYYEAHACYWSGEEFALLAPEIEARIWWLVRQVETSGICER